MTNEEAIKVLEQIRQWTDYPKEALTMAIGALSISSLPSNLDEAAQKVEDYYDVGEEHGYLCCHRGDIKDAFKAGAEWMAGQGYTKETQVYANRWTDVDEVIVNLGQGEYGFKAGDKVTVQIRKKV